MHNPDTEGIRQAYCPIHEKPAASRRTWAHVNRHRLGSPKRLATSDCQSREPLLRLFYFLFLLHIPVYDYGYIHNASHFLQGCSRLWGGGIGSSRGQAEQDPDWCREVWRKTRDKVR